MAKVSKNCHDTFSRLIIGLAFVFAASSIISGCAGGNLFIPPPKMPDDMNHVTHQPEPRKIPLIYDGIDKITFQQVRESLDFSRQLRHLAGRPKQALNVNAFDEVDNSSWFTNRNATKRLSIEEIAKGPDRGNGPDIDGQWTIVRAKLEGVTPGFTIQDSRGDTYLIKFDPKGYSELATGAEVISTKLFYAAGYHTPENYLVYFHPDILRMEGNVKFIDEKGHKAFMTETDLQKIMKKIEILPDGRIRALASKYIPGTPIGPFTYQGFRKDDPNDFIPHQHRRELRGLRVMSTWLKHTDTKDGNTLDAFVEDNGRSFVKHFLIDFGSTLGSAAHGPFSPEAGYVHYFDPKDIFENTVSLGLNVDGWEKNKDFQFASIGRYRSDTFEPHKFKNNIPNPAFELMTNLDGYWGAKLVMSFTDEQLEAVVKEAQYSDPDAETYLLRTLKERRDIVGRRWFSLVNPLDHFRLDEDSHSSWKLSFVDLAVDGNLESMDQARYRYDLKINGEIFGKDQDLGNSTSIMIPDDIPSDKNHQLEFTIRIMRSENGKWGKWVKIYLQYDQISGEYFLIGLRRQE